MRKLLRANFYRLKKSLLLLLCAAAACLLSLIVMIGIHPDGENLRTLDEILLQPFPFLVLIEAVFISLFLGAEYQDGTLRNKLIVGHSRSQVYLASLAAALAGCLAVMGGWLLSAAFGAVKFGWFVSPARSVLQAALLIAMIAVANAAVLTLLGMLCTNRAYGAVAAILLMLGLIVLSSSLYNALSEPEMASSMALGANGLEMTEPEPNPAYVSGWRRAVYQFAVDTLPFGQSILLTNQEITRPVLSLCGSGCIALFSTLAGMFFFRRKDLK